MDKFKDFIKIVYRPMPILKSYGGFLVLRNPKKFKETWGIRTSFKNILVLNGNWYFKEDEFSKFKEKVGRPDWETKRALPKDTKELCSFNVGWQNTFDN